MKGRIAVIAILVCAFTWGYKLDSIMHYLEFWRKEKPAEFQETLIGTKLSDLPSLPPPGPPVQTGMVGAGKIPPPPYPVKGQQNTLSNTLDSIRPGQIQPQQITQRNEYFEKLSQQLKELRGDGTAPPPAPEPINGNPPPQLGVPPDQFVGYPGAGNAAVAPGIVPPPPPPGYPGGGELVQNAPPPAGLDQSTGGADPEEVDDETDSPDEDEDTDADAADAEE